MVSAAVLISSIVRGKRQAIKTQKTADGGRFLKTARATIAARASVSLRIAFSLLKAAQPQLQLVTPGIRPAGSAADDQKRILTPQQALAAGADYLVIGRPISQALDPAAALAAIVAGLA